MNALKQIGGFLVFMGFLWGVSLLGNALLALGLPGIVAWPAAFLGLLVLPVAALVGWQRMAAWRLESRPGVKAWKDLDDRAFSLHKLGDFAAAQPLYEQALPLAETSKLPIVIATAANNLAGLYVDQERYADALPLFQRAYQLRQEKLGVNDQLTLTTAERVSGCLGALDRWSDVEALQREVLPVYRKLSSDGPAVGETLRTIAIACRHQGKYDDAGRLYQEEEALLRKERGLESERAARMYNDWGYLMVAAGWPGQGIPLYEKAIAIREREGDPLALATTLDNLADAQTASGDPITAAQTSDRWFTLTSRLVTQRSGVNDHPLLAPVLEQHAARLAAAGGEAEADGLRTRAKALREQHPDEVARYQPVRE